MGNTYGKKWFMFDIARQRCFHREEMKALIEVLHRCGYNGIGLYIEGFFQFPAFGGAPREGCMTADDAKWICKLAKQYDMILMPMTNLVGHAESFLCQERFKSFGKSESQFDMKAKGFSEFAKSVIDQFIDCFEPKIIHIGGDEVSLDDEGRKDYVKFLSDICDYLSNKGVITGMWADTFLIHPECAQNMNKDVLMFDWWYYGHRYESTEIIKNAGFKNIVVAPGTQSWNSIVGTQQMCPWRDEMRWRYDKDVAPDEVEAFLIDSQKQDVYDAMLTDWENYQGHLMWNSLHIIARFGQFVNGKGLSDKELSCCLFDRDTPFMECMHIIMGVQKQHYAEAEKLPGRYYKHTHIMDGVFLTDALNKTLQCGDCMSAELAVFYEQAASKVNKLLSDWNPISDLEDRCKRSLQFAAAYSQSMSEILNLAHKTKALYRKASFEQFKNPKKYSEMLARISDSFSTFAKHYTEWIEVFENAIKDSGHTRNDIRLLNNVKQHIEKLVIRLADFDVQGIEYKKGLALLSWNVLLCEIFGNINVND